MAPTVEQAAAAFFERPTPVLTLKATVSVPTRSTTSAHRPLAAYSVRFAPAAAVGPRVDVGAGLQVAVHQVDGSTVVAVRGDVCSDTAAGLAAVLATLGAPRLPRRAVVLDLSGATLLSAAGITLIVEHRNAWAADGPALVLANPQGVVARALDVCGIPLAPAHHDGH